MNNNERWMKRALSLAKRGLGRTSPNPCVGAVIVEESNGVPVVAGEGFHEKAGFAHAEVVALEKAGNRAKGAALYVTLEPCCHYGKTPPCIDKIINAGVSKVFIATPDPNPIVNWHGISKLKEAGIQVNVGVCENEAVELNEAFFKFISVGLPFVALKWGMTLDGKIATVSGDSRWITGERSRRIVHQLRNQYDAVMVGARTVMKDDPLLTSRIRGGRNPKRIILDPDCLVTDDRKIFQAPLEAPTLIVYCKEPEQELRESLESRGVEFINVLSNENGRPEIEPLLRYLGSVGIMSVLVEGGGGVNAWMLEDGSPDKVYAFISPKIVGGKEAKTPVEGAGAPFVKDALNLVRTEFKKVGDDILVKGYFN